MPLSGKFRVMSDRITRNILVAWLGTPDKTEGSLNDPVEREEHGIHYNEKWIYRHLHDDPAGAAERLVYWHRYDFTGTLIRKAADAEWIADTAVAQWAQSGGHKLATVDDHHSAFSDNQHYHPVSEVRDGLDLGGYIQGQKK
jgi:hypothetical protein